MLIVSVIV